MLRHRCPGGEGRRNVLLLNYRNVSVGRPIGVADTHIFTVCSRAAGR